jgi:AcrR family transcriptional regulator
MAATGQRARSEEAKLARRQALLDAARVIAKKRGVREVTLTEVAAKVGLHPSAVRRYFESREELLLELAEEGWVEWRDGLRAEFDGRRGLDASDLAAAITASLVELPLFCDLLTHTALSLEGAVRLARARRYKAAASEAYEEMIVEVADAARDLDADGVRVLLSTAVAAAGHLFQLSRPTATLRRLYREEPRWAHGVLDFRDRLERLLGAVARGEARAQARD